jgi:hypothetical protein
VSMRHNTYNICSSTIRTTTSMLCTINSISSHTSLIKYTNPAAIRWVLPSQRGQDRSLRLSFRDPKEPSAHCHGCLVRHERLSEGEGFFLACNKKAKCWCFYGWVCEEHPDKPWRHGRCEAAGIFAKTHNAKKFQILFFYPSIAEYARQEETGSKKNRIVKVCVVAALEVQRGRAFFLICQGACKLNGIGTLLQPNDQPVLQCPHVSETSREPLAAPSGTPRIAAEGDDAFA